MLDLIKASQGDDKAFNEIVGAYNGKLLKIANIYVKSDYESIVQDMWVKIYKKRFLLAGVDNLDNWLFLILRNCCFDYLKVERKRQKAYSGFTLEQIDAMNINYSSNIIDHVISKGLSEEIKNILNNLPEMYAIPIILYYYENIPQAEIALMLNLSISALKWRLRTGKLKIKKEIIERNLL